MNVTVAFPNQIVEELARLINLWAENDWVETTRDTLVVWAENSVSRTPQPPRPNAGIQLLEALDLVRQINTELLVPLDALKTGYRVPDHLDRFSAPTSQIVFDALCGCPEYSEHLYAIFGLIKYQSSQLTVDWNSVPKTEKENVAWRWLQQLGLADHLGEVVLIDDCVSHYVLETPIGRRSLSQTELDERLQAQRDRADLAEEHVLNAEKDRLSNAGASEYLDGVIRISIEDVEAGYDIHSYETDGTTRRIEVKSSAGPRRRFFLSNNEYQTANRDRESYWIAWVSNSERLPNGPSQITWFRDPIGILSHSQSPWEIESTASCVNIIEDDSRFAFND